MVQYLSSAELERLLALVAASARARRDADCGRHHSAGRRRGGRRRVVAALCRASRISARRARRARAHGSVALSQAAQPAWYCSNTPKPTSRSACAPPAIRSSGSSYQSRTQSRAHVISRAADLILASNWHLPAAATASSPPPPRGAAAATAAATIATVARARRAVEAEDDRLAEIAAEMARKANRIARPAVAARIPRAGGHAVPAAALAAASTPAKRSAQRVLDIERDRIRQEALEQLWRLVGRIERIEPILLARRRDSRGSPRSDP